MPVSTTVQTKLTMAAKQETTPLALMFYSTDLRHSRIAWTASLFGKNNMSSCSHLLSSSYSHHHYREAKKMRRGCLEKKHMDCWESINF